MMARWSKPQRVMESLVHDQDASDALPHSLPVIHYTWPVTDLSPPKVGRQRMAVGCASS